MSILGYPNACCVLMYIHRTKRESWSVHLLGDSKLDPNDPRNAALLEVTKVCLYTVSM